MVAQIGRYSVFATLLGIIFCNSACIHLRRQNFQDIGSNYINKEARSHLAIIEVNRVDRCYGVLIAPNWIMTSCNCLTDLRNATYLPGEISVHTGVSVSLRTNLIEGNGTYRVKKMIFHPRRSSDVLSPSNFDLVLLNLDIPVGGVKLLSFTGLDSTWNLGLMPIQGRLLAYEGSSERDSIALNAVRSTDIQYQANGNASSLIKIKNTGKASADRLDRMGSPLFYETLNVRRQGPGYTRLSLVGVKSNENYSISDYTNLFYSRQWILYNILEVRFNVDPSRKNEINCKIINAPRDSKIKWWTEDYLSRQNGNGATAKLNVKKIGSGTKIFFRIETTGLVYDKSFSLEDLL